MQQQLVSGALLTKPSQRFYNEVHTFDLLYRGGAHVAQFMGVSSTEEHPFSLLYEFMEGRDLRWYLRNEPDVGRLKLVLIPTFATR